MNDPTHNDRIEEYTQAEIEMLETFAEWRRLCNEIAVASDEYRRQGGYSFSYHFAEIIRARDEAEAKVRELAAKKARILLGGKNEK